MEMELSVSSWVDLEPALLALFNHCIFEECELVIFSNVLLRKKV